MEKPKYNQETGEHEINGISFRGHFNEWKLEYIPKTYLKESNLSGDQYRKGGSVKIYLNGDCVCNEFCREEDMAIVLLSKHLHELKCHFEIQGVDLENWKEKLIGRKIYHAGVPSIIESYCGDGEILVRTESGEPYGIYGHKKEDFKEDPKNYEDEWLDKDRIHITDERIYWFRK